MIVVRKAQKKDVKRLSELLLVTRRETFYWEDPSRFKLTDYRRLTRGEVVFLAEREGEILGMLSIWEEERPPFIHNLFVACEHQGKGIGQLLIESLKEHSINPPYRLKCVLKNEKALKFYKKNGWKEIEEGIAEEGEYVLLESS
jgi:GNAT superfamily N-acetyltransferase